PRRAVSLPRAVLPVSLGAADGRSPAGGGSRAVGRGTRGRAGEAGDARPARGAEPLPLSPTLHPRAGGDAAPVPGGGTAPPRGPAAGRSGAPGDRGGVRGRLRRPLALRPHLPPRGRRLPRAVPASGTRRAQLPPSEARLLPGRLTFPSRGRKRHVRS